MSYRSPVALAAAIVVGLAALARATDAQGASVSAVGLDAGHRLLAGMLLGASAWVTIPLTDVLSMHVGAERVTGHDRRTGTPCAGLILPGTCPPEPLRDNARLTTVAVAWRRGLR